MALFGSDQVIDQFPGRKIYVGKKEGNKLENITVFEMDDKALPVKVTYARTGMLEADLANKQILMHLYQARYQERDAKDPFNLHKIRDGINMVEGTLPISLEELYEKEKKRPIRSALSIEQLLEQLKSEDKRERSASRTEINKRFSFPFACVAFAIIGVPLGVTAHRRETSVGFAMALIVATMYFLFVIIGDTLRGNPQLTRSYSSGFRTFCLSCWARFCSAVSRGNDSKAAARAQRPMIRNSSLCSVNRQNANYSGYRAAHSAVVGSMMVRTSEIRFAGKPPCLACSRISSALGAM